MGNAVEALPISAPSMLTKNGMRGTTGKNPTFFRTNESGDTKCWIAVDSETGTVDIRDENEQTLLEINGKSKKAILSGLDLSKGITDAQESADSANTAISQAKDDIQAVKEKARAAQRTADQAVEEAAEVHPEILQNLREEGLELQHEQRLTARKDGQLLVNGKVFKGEKGETGDKGKNGDPGIQGPEGPQGEPGIDGQEGLRGIQGEKGKNGLKGDKGPRGKAGSVHGINFDSLSYRMNPPRPTPDAIAKQSLLNFRNINDGPKYPSIKVGRDYSEFVLLKERVESVGRPFMVVIQTSEIAMHTKCSFLSCSINLNGGKLYEEVLRPKTHGYEYIRNFNITRVFSFKPGHHNIELKLWVDKQFPFSAPRYQAYLLEL